MFFILNLCTGTRIRTQNCGFGDRNDTISPYPCILCADVEIRTLTERVWNPPDTTYAHPRVVNFVEKVGIDPTPLVFQTSAITLSATFPSWVYDR